MRLVGWWCTIHVEAGGDGRVVHVGRLGWCLILSACISSSVKFPMIQFSGIRRNASLANPRLNASNSTKVS